MLARYDALSDTALARRLADVTIGPTSLWDALRYDVADAIFEEAYGEACFRALARQSEPARSSVSRLGKRAGDVVRRNLWQAQIGQEFFVGLLSARLGRVGDLLESGFFLAHSAPPWRAQGSRVDVLVAGSLYRTAVAALGPVLQELGRSHGLTHLVLTHDDVLLRHGRAFSRVGLHWRHAAAFSSRAHRIAASAIVKRARAALADVPASPRVMLPDVITRRCLSARAVRRLALNFLAAQDSLARCDPSVVVIPDERQPLARLVGLEAGRRGLPVVSAPLPRDQLFRKTPLWNGCVSTRVLVFSPVAARFMGRAGASPHLFEGASELGPAAPDVLRRPDCRLRYRQVLNLESGTRIVLFASQGKPSNAVLLPMMTACIETLAAAALVVRPHPDEWLPLVKLMNPRALVSRAMSAREAIQAADVLVTQSSFMAVEAALIGCPVVLLSHDSVPQLMPLVTEGLAKWVSTAEDLRHTLHELLGNGGRASSAQESFAAEHAKMRRLERAAALIADLAVRVRG